MRSNNLGDTLTGEVDSDALIDLSGPVPRHFTHKRFDGLANAFAGTLNVERGQRIGILASNSAAFAAAYLGIMRAGAVAVPINTKFPDSTIAHVIKDANLVSVFHDDDNGGRFSGAKALSLQLPDDSEDFSSIAPEQGEAGLVLYTSGSTGMPKGVELSHDSQWAMVSRMNKAFTGVTGIVAAPLYHMNGLLMLMALFAGQGTVVLMPRFSARTFLQAIHDHRVNVITGVPTMLSLMLKEEDLLSSLDLECIAAITVGSAPLSEALINEIQAVIPKARISNGYGTTEAGAGMFGPHPSSIPVPALSLGYPQPHVDVRLKGEVDGKGILEVRTPAAMSRYLNMPEKTAEKMADDGWIDTGDIMRRDEQGFYYFVGRDDDMFNCGGENVYPGQVERVLEGDKRIAESCVVPVSDEVRGQMPVVYVVTSPGAEISEDEVKEVALAGMPAYAHPRHVFFLETMPLAGTNKIDRHELARDAAERLLV